MGYGDILRFEQTIRAAVECSGIGLHSGVRVKMRIVPAAPGSGIVFRRTDLDDFQVEATGRNVAKVSYATSLMKKGVLISTTEHVLSAFVGMGVDNAIVELDNLELPILDGSALPIVEMVQRVGLRRQKRLRQYLRVLKAVEVHEGEKFVGLYPAESFSVCYTINFPHPLIGEESICVDLSRGDYARDIAPARTFGFLQRGGSSAQHGTDPRRQRRKRHRAHPRRNQERAAAFSRRVCAAQGAGPDRRSLADWTPGAGARGGRPRRTRHAHRAGQPLLRDPSSWELATMGESVVLPETVSV